jgi:hypothetical protein
MKAAGSKRKRVLSAGQGQKRTPNLKPPAAGKDQPPFLEFLSRAQGTLPEIISEAQLDTVNSALRFLFTHLRQARRQFHEEKDGRAGAFTALGAYWMFIVLFEAPLAESLQVPILRLQDALVGLDKGYVDPIVRPMRRRGRAPSSEVYAALKGQAAGTVKRLMEIDFDRRNSHEMVANQLRRLGVRAERGSGVVTANTVRNWCDAVSSDVGRHGTAAQMYDSMFARPEVQQRYSAMPKAQAGSLALDILAAWVRSTLPELQKPT